MTAKQLLSSVYNFFKNILCFLSKHARLNQIWPISIRRGQLFILARLLLLLLLYLIRRVQPCGYDTLIYMLRTLGLVSFLHLFSTCILVRSSSFVSGFVCSPIRVLLPDLSAEKKRSWNGGGEWPKGINGIHGCGSISNYAPVLPPLRPLSYSLLIFPIPTCYLSRPHFLSVGATLVWLLLLT